MDLTKTLVVGYDGSPDASRALSWAADLSRLAGTPLRVLVARGDLYTVSTWADEWSLGLAEEWATKAKTHLAELGATADVSIADGMASQALVAASQDASLVAVGSHGHGAVMGMLQGSVSQHVSRHAACPVVVVRQTQDDTARRVVVGVDGSPASLEALESALHLAGLQGHELEILYASDRLAYREVPDPRLLERWDADDAAVLAEAAEVLARHEGVAFQTRVVHDRPVHALVDASHRAALVVVGSRGRGAFSAMLLGSVSAGILQHAHCPVVVTR